MGRAASRGGRRHAGAGRRRRATCRSPRIRGANRNADGAYFETVTLVTHAGRPLASRCCCRDEGGEIAALRALLEDVDLRGCVVTRDTERPLVEARRIAARDLLPGTFAAAALTVQAAPSSSRSNR